MTGSGAWLLVSLFFAHFLGDFTPLSTPWMREAKATGRPVGPIAAHAGIHAVLVGLAVATVTRSGLPIVLAALVLEFASHLAIDLVRGRLGGRDPSLGDPNAQAFWTILGIDQFAHYLVLLWIAIIVL